MDKKIQIEVQQRLLPKSVLIILVPTTILIITIATIIDHSVFAAKSRGAFSPTGYCATGGTTCIPCDPGVSPYCIPSSNWPGGGGFASNTVHGSKANPPANNNPLTSSQSAP
jgi:hypothetical protein